jgi:acyl-coenzyme A thioesterase PaaI-like protein
MSNTAVAVASLQVETFPAGTVAGSVLFSLLDSASNVVSTSVVATGATDAVAQASFSISVPGTYKVSAVRQDASNNVLGSAVVSADFVVAAPVTVSVSVPTSVAVTLS